MMDEELIAKIAEYTHNPSEVGVIMECITELSLWHGQFVMDTCKELGIIGNGALWILYKVLCHSSAAETFINIQHGIAVDRLELLPYYYTATGQTPPGVKSNAE